MSERFAWIYDPVAGVKRWCADMWSRRHILALQQAIAAIVVPTAFTTNPQMDGTATPGVSTDYARGDHVHPSDTAKQDALTSAQLAAVNSGITAEYLNYKFGIVEGITLGESGETSAYAYPTNFSFDNCVIISLLIEYNGAWDYAGDGVMSGSGRLFAKTTTEGVIVRNSASYGFSKNFKVILMRTDI